VDASDNIFGSGTDPAGDDILYKLNSSGKFMVLYTFGAQPILTQRLAR
jgi:hypothetical protein